MKINQYRWSSDVCLCSPDVTETVVIESKNYMKKLVEQANLNFIVTGKVKETGQIVTAMKVVTLHNPKLIVEVWNDASIYILTISETFYTMNVCFHFFQVSGPEKVNEEMLATVKFTNPFTFNLEGVFIRMEGPGIMPPKFKYYRWVCREKMCVSFICMISAVSVQTTGYTCLGLFYKLFITSVFKSHHTRNSAVWAFLRCKVKTCLNNGENSH